MFGKKQRLNNLEDKVDALISEVERLKSILSRRENKPQKSMKELQKEWFTGENKK